MSGCSNNSSLFVTTAPDSESISNTPYTFMRESSLVVATIMFLHGFQWTQLTSGTVKVLITEAVCAQEQLDLWESDTGNRLQTITHRFRRPVFSFDDQFVMFVSEDRLHVWDCPTFIQPHSYLMPKPVEEDEDRFHHYFVLKPSLRGSLVMVIETEVSHETLEEYCLNYYEGAASYRVSLRREDHIIDACFGSTDDIFLLVKFAGIDVYCAQTASVIRTFTVPYINSVHWDPCKNVMVATTRDDSRLIIYGVLEMIIHGVLEIDSESGAVVTKSEPLFEHPDNYISQ
jgi:hypothetical protein